MGVSEGKRWFFPDLRERIKSLKITQINEKHSLVPFYPNQKDLTFLEIFVSWLRSAKLSENMLEIIYFQGIREGQNSSTCIILSCDGTNTHLWFKLPYTRVRTKEWSKYQNQQNYRMNFEQIHIGCKNFGAVSGVW